MSESRVSGVLVVPLAEEADALEQSRKKVRMGEGQASNERAVIPKEEDWIRDDSRSEAPADGAFDHGKKSYKQACTGKENSDSEQEKNEADWWSNDGWKNRVKVEKTERGPNIVLLPEFKKKVAKRWRCTLLVTLLGKMVREDYLSSKLQQIWGLHGEVEMLDIGSGYFFVTFKSKDDYDMALTGGPWLVMDHYLAIQP